MEDEEWVRAGSLAGAEWVQGCGRVRAGSDLTHFALERSLWLLPEGGLREAGEAPVLSLILGPYQNPESTFLFSNFILNLAKKKPAFSKAEVVHFQCQVYVSLPCMVRHGFLEKCLYSESKFFVCLSSFDLV